MKKANFVLLVLIVSIVTSDVFAQNLNLIPNELKTAFKNGTRQPDGKPGAFYWQNNAKYKIDAILDAENSVLNGEATITYFNNSPDSLSSIVMRLYQNFYREGNARGWYIGSADLSEGMVIDSISTENIISKQIPTSTNLILKLENSINPGDSTQVYVKWHFHIPEKSWLRMGNYGKDRFFVAYWYPQIAVYDDIDGWDMNEYFGATEFYNDFNDFDVKIETPSKFIVWATGDLQKSENHFQKGILKRIELANSNDEIVKIITAKDRAANKVFVKGSHNIWQFKATYVPDFTFGAAKNYNWDATSVEVDSISKRRVFVDAVYPDSTTTFQDGAKWSAKSIELMSFSLPGIPFPYEHMTSFCNGRKNGGMESPMMANNGDPETMESAVGLFYHEISHSYFPFFMGTNERKYAWMDEGWATYLTNEIMNEVAPEYNYLERVGSNFTNLNGSEKEVSLMTLSHNITDYNAYRVHAYNRSALANHFLRDVLGDSIFKMALHEYIYRWQGRHPIPYDFFSTMADASGQSLLWFFVPWYFETANADLGIKKVTTDNKIIIENYGGLPLPISLKVKYSDGSTEEFYENTSIWRSGDKAVIIQMNFEKEILTVDLGNNSIPDIDHSNNKFESQTTSN
jgi:hypothetical protein